MIERVTGSDRACCWQRSSVLLIAIERAIDSDRARYWQRSNALLTALRSRVFMSYWQYFVSILSKDAREVDPFRRSPSILGQTDPAGPGVHPSSGSNLQPSSDTCIADQSFGACMYNICYITQFLSYACQRRKRRIKEWKKDEPNCHFYILFFFPLREKLAEIMKYL